MKQPNINVETLENVHKKITRPKFERGSIKGMAAGAGTNTHKYTLPTKFHAIV